jgi:hypothetical protein
MFGRLGRFLRYFRWSLGLGLSVFVILLSLLQPRPVAQCVVPLQRGTFDRVEYSSSGKYAVLFNDIFHNIVLVDLPSGQCIFDIPVSLASACRFNAADSLVFATNAKSDDDVDFWCWQPGMQVPAKIFSRPEYIRNLYHHESLYAEGFNGIAGFDTGNTMNCCLSPDGSRWVIPIRDQATFRFEIVDSQTGQLVTQLDALQYQFQPDKKPACEIAFSTDSSKLILQYPLAMQSHVDNSYALEVMSTLTGRRLWEIKLPYQTKLAQLLFFDDKRVLAWEKENNLDYLQHVSLDKGYQRFLLKETVAEPVEQSVPKMLESIQQASVEVCNPTEVRDGKLIYCWVHQALPKHGALGGGMPYLPGFYFAVRDVETGQLLRSDKLPLRQREPEDYGVEDWQLHEVLPRQVLLLQKKFDRSPAHLRREDHPRWKITLDTWRQRYASWIPSFLIKPAHLVGIKADTGKPIEEITLGIDYETRVFAHHLSQQRQLCLAYSDGPGVHFVKYQYPFHKPWLLSLMWSLGVFVVLACIQWLLHLSRFAKRREGSKST